MLSPGDADPSPLVQIKKNDRTQGRVCKGSVTLTEEIDHEAAIAEAAGGAVEECAAFLHRELDAEAGRIGPSVGVGVSKVEDHALPTDATGVHRQGQKQQQRWHQEASDDREAATAARHCNPL